MPKKPRGIICQEIKNHGLRIKDELLKAYRIADPRALAREAQAIRTVQGQVTTLEEDCDNHSRYAYAQNNKMRQVLMVAANELELVRLELDDAISEAIEIGNQPYTAELKDRMFKLISKYTLTMLKLGRIEFQHEIRRTRPTLEDLERQVAEETSTTERAYSTLNNSDPEQKPGALGDAQLGSLNNLFGG